MPEQLSLLDEEAVAQPSSSPIWAQLPAQVRAELSERFVELLVRIARPSPVDEESAHDFRQDQADSSEP
jgi:hypothetical protein